MSIQEWSYSCLVNDGNKKVFVPQGGNDATGREGGREHLVTKSMQLVASCVRASHALQEHLSILFRLFSEKGNHIIKASTSQDGFCVTFQELGG